MKNFTTLIDSYGDEITVELNSELKTEPEAYAHPVYISGVGFIARRSLPKLQKFIANALKKPKATRKVRPAPVSSGGSC